MDLTRTVYVFFSFVSFFFPFRGANAPLSEREDLWFRATGGGDWIYCSKAKFICLMVSYPWRCADPPLLLLDSKAANWICILHRWGISLGASFAGRGLGKARLGFLRYGW